MLAGHQTLRLTERATMPKTSTHRLQSHITTDLVIFLAMVLGIVAKELWDNLHTTGAFSLNITRIASALIVAPLVFAGFYQQFKRRGLSLPVLALAFQNGFFWRTVLG